jgi:N-acetylglucosamine malate deacetylase 1
MNPYLKFASDFSRLVNEGRSLPLGNIPPEPRPAPAAAAPAVLVFSPHPDDECIIGGLALRLLRELGWRVINVAVTQGSNKERQGPRLQELQQACQWLGFGLEQTAPSGLERISPKTRQQDPAHWASAVDAVAHLLAKHLPKVVFFPHEADYNSTHIGTHFLVMDALKKLPASFHCSVVETEFWAQMSTPNLMIESSVEDVAALLAALSFHVGEVARNPYHLRFPAWLQDNVRRGAEVVGGQGGAAPDFMFATLYRLRQWENGALTQALSRGRSLSFKDSLQALFPG